MHVHAKPLLAPAPDLRPATKPPAPAKSRGLEALFALGQERGGRGGQQHRQRQPDPSEAETAQRGSDPAAALAALLARIDLDAAT